MAHDLTLSNGNGKDTLRIEPAGSRGDKLMILTKHAEPPVVIKVRLTGDEWRAIKELR